MVLEINQEIDFSNLILEDTLDLRDTTIYKRFGVKDLKYKDGYVYLNNLCLSDYQFYKSGRADLKYKVSDNIIELYRNNINLYNRKCTTMASIVNNIWLDIKNKVEKAMKLDRDILKEIDPQIYANIEDMAVHFLSNYLDTKIKLYNFQKYDILKMREIERNIDLNKNTITQQFYKCKNTNNYIHVFNSGILIDNVFVKKDLINIESSEFKTLSQNTTESFTINYHGGLLASEMGLGKTIVSLYHILYNNKEYRDSFLNKYLESSITLNKCNYVFKAGKKRGKLCNKKTVNGGSTCKEHIGKVYKTAIRLKPGSFIPIKKDTEGLIVTNCTLILCPNHLAHQWYTEFIKHFNEGRGAVVLTAMEMNVLSTNDVLVNDFLVIPYGYEDRLMYKYKFQRVIFDEIHEPLKYSKAPLIRGKYNWLISGTPLPKGDESHREMADILTNTSLTNIKDLTFRHTKNSTRNELEKNLIREHLYKLEFSNAEKSIYEAKKANSNYEFLIRMCCHTNLIGKNDTDLTNMIKECNSMEDVYKLLVKSAQHKVKKYVDILHEKYTELQILQSINNKTDLDKQEITYLQASIGQHKSNLRNAETTYNYMENIWKTLTSNEELECPICLSNLRESNDWCITRCGHVFSVECLGLSRKKTIACPMCKTKLEKNDVYVVSPGLKKKKSIDIELQKIIDKVKSTKMGNIIYFLNKLDKNDKVIVFSQWDSLLTELNKYLAQSGIKTTVCVGSVHQRNRAIKEFCEGKDVQVIMLSSKNSASGINLTIANKIIFMEPVYGTSEYRYNIERQAIGRADRIGRNKPIDVYRFIIQDTIEEDIIDNQYHIKEQIQTDEITPQTSLSITPQTSLSITSQSITQLTNANAVAGPSNS